MPSAPLVKVTAVEYTLSSNTLPHPVQHLKYTHTNKKTIAPRIQNPKRTYFSAYRFSMALRLESGKKKKKKKAWILLKEQDDSRESIDIVLLGNLVLRTIRAPRHCTSFFIPPSLFSKFLNNCTLLRSHQEPQILTTIWRTIFCRNGLNWDERARATKIKRGSEAWKRKSSGVLCFYFCVKP